MSRSRYRSLINSILLGGALLAGAACGGEDDPTCGPGNAPASGLVAGNNGVALTFGALEGGPNNDCPAAGAPAGLTSLTIVGTQSDGTGLITLCVARPDLFATTAQQIGGDAASSQIRIIDLSGTANGCQLTLDRAQTISGSATSSGLCDNGDNSAGFALTVTGAVSLTRTCGSTVDTVAVTLSGTVAVAHGL